MVIKPSHVNSQDQISGIDDDPKKMNDLTNGHQHHHHHDDTSDDNDIVCSRNKFNSSSEFKDALEQLPAPCFAASPITLDMVNARDNQGRSPLYLAAQSRDLDIVELLLRYGADAKSLAADGSSVLLAVFEDHPLDKKHSSSSSSSSSSSDGKSVDELSCEIVELLIENGAPLDSLDARGRNALHMAIDYELPQTSLMLLQTIDELKNDTYRRRLPDLEDRDYEGRTVLHAAAQSRMVDLVELLLLFGADPHSLTNERKSVLHSLLDEDFEEDNATREKSRAIDIFRRLVKAGVSVTGLDKRQQSLLHLAAEHDIKEIVRDLLPMLSKDDLATITTWGCTALHTLLCSIDDERSYPDLLNAMFEANKNVVLVKDDEGRLPIHLAAKYKHKKILELMLSKYGQEKQTTATNAEEIAK